MRSRATGDGGAVLVELALVVPVFILVMLGIMEYGTTYRETLNLSGATRAAARQATSAGAVRNADYLALQAFVATMGQANNVTIEKVVIYQTTNSAGDPLDPSCFTQANPAATYHCNVYTGAQIDSLGCDSLTHFGPTIDACGASAWDASWCPLSRKDRQGDPPDKIGVYAVVRYTSVTSLLPVIDSLADKAVMQIEPRVS